jgi:hypothetical protein
MDPKFPPGLYWVVGGDTHDRKRASFRLRGDRLEPDVITELTGLTPDMAHRKGDPRQESGRRGLPPWSSGLWSIDSSPDVPDEGTRLEDHVTWLLDRLEPQRDQLRQICAEQALKADFFCGYSLNQSNGGTELASGTLERIAALGASFGIDIYAPEPGTPARSILVGGES